MAIRMWEDGVLAFAGGQGAGQLGRFLARRAVPQDRDDVAQEVALRLHQRGPGTDLACPDAFAMRVARNVMADRWRRDRARARDQHVPLEEFHHPVEELSPARVMEGRETLALVLRSLEELPERTRHIFVLQRMEGMSYSAIASQLEISVSAVEKHMSKAIRHLATCLGD